MSNDTIYLRQLLAFKQAAVREVIGVNLADVRQLQDELHEKGVKFNKGIIPEKEAADFALKISMDTHAYVIRANKELEQLQGEHKKPIQYSPEMEKGFNMLSEEQKKMTLSEVERIRQLPISNIENIISELNRLNKMAMCLNAHIQDYVITPEYRERRRTFLTTGEAPKDPAPDTQPSYDLTNEEILKKLEDIGLIVSKIIDGKQFCGKKNKNTAPKIYKEILKFTNDDEDRAIRIIRNNIPEAQSGIKQHRYRNKK